MRPLYPEFAGAFVHDAVLSACSRFGEKTAIVDASLPEADPRRRISYSRYGELVESLGRGLQNAGLKTGETVGIFLPNSWEFAAAYHASTLAGLVPTPLNPHYREREVRYQLQDAGVAALISDGAQLAGIDLSGLPKLRRVWTTRTHAVGTESFSSLLGSGGALRATSGNSQDELAALPYSSGTTGMPKGVMLTHENLVENVRQFLVPGEIATTRAD
ncbi:MAG: acyl--CoA ligase, partial [Acidobacteriales bacterium]|nr:acyl--CoA ligase [Terriglobales bacterium]